MMKRQRFNEWPGFPAGLQHDLCQRTILKMGYPNDVIVETMRIWFIGLVDAGSTRFQADYSVQS